MSLRVHRLRDNESKNSSVVQAKSPRTIPERVAEVHWASVISELDAEGHSVIQGLLTADECRELVDFYPQEDRFRSRVVMERHAFGRGEYKYFAYPLPDLVSNLRISVYPHLASTANRWSSAMGLSVQYPSQHSDFIKQCHRSGQVKPTPLMLRYGREDYNCLHQDLYGEHVFPLQLTVLLSEPQADFTGGEFVMTEQRPRMQSRPMVVPLSQGDAVVFAVQNRPVKGAKGFYRVTLRHGVSRIRSGQRYALGVIFHDAK